MGRVYRPKYAYTRADGTRVEKQTEAWYIEYGDASGRWIRRKAGITKEQAQDALRKAEADVLSEKNGLPVQKASESSCRRLVAAYLEAQRTRVTAYHLGDLTRRLKYVLDKTRAATVRHLTPEAIERLLSELADKGRSARSLNCYLQAIKGCLAWAVRTRKLPYSPLDCVQRRPETLKARRRRALSEDEIARLLQAAAGGPLRRATESYKGGHDGTPRLSLAKQARLAEQGREAVLIYRLMIEAGLRRNEVRTLAWEDVDLEAGTLTIRAHNAKNRKEATVPLTPGLLAALARWRDARPSADGGPVVRLSSRLLRHLNDDLEAAGIPKKDAGGSTVDLHALRHTYGTRLVASGVDIKTAQMLMRHSSPILTLGIYVHSDRVRLRQAVEQLPVVAPAVEECVAAVPTPAAAGT
jgi:integrase